MAFALVTSTIKSTGANGGTTDAVDTTGANLLVVVVGEYDGGTHSAVTDSKGNTWSELTTQDGTNAQSTIFYCLNPTVGSGHTFTYSATNSYSTIAALAFSGAHASSSFDQQNGGFGAGTSLSTGSVTPSEDNELLIAGVCTDGAQGSDHAINSSFTIAQAFNFDVFATMGCAAAYKIQTSAGAENPAWSWTNSINAAAVIATFKAAAGGSFIDNTSNILRSLWVTGTPC